MSDIENQDVEYFVDDQNIDTSASLADEDETVDFQFEAQAVFKRLADDIYETPEAGIREPLQNAITTVRKVFGTGSGGVVKVTVQRGDQTRVRIRDNGEGINKSILNQVLTYIGRSTARDNGELSGQYGMGFLATYKLVGVEDGGFVMYTNPRDTDEGPYGGIFKPGTYEPDKKGKLPQMLDEDDYGTVFDFYVKEGINAGSIREWVEKHSKWSPVPIIYEELDETGDVVYNEDYHSPSFTDSYSSDLCIHIENEYYEVACSPSSKGDVVLISSPAAMRKSRYLSRNIPWDVDIRLKYENGMIIDGTHKGLAPVSETEYNSMNSNRKDGYIKEDELSSSDIKLPEPTGTREKVRYNRDFVEYINDKLKSEYQEIVKESMGTIESALPDYTDIDSKHQEVLHHFLVNLSKSRSSWNKDWVARKVRNYGYQTSSDSDLTEFIMCMSERLPVMTRKHGGGRKKYEREKVYSLFEESERVYMTVGRSWKIEAIKESDVEAEIIQVDSASDYETFEKYLGWSKVKSISESSAVNELGLTEDKVEDIRGVRKSDNHNPDDVSEKLMNVHYGDVSRKQEASTVVENFDGTSYINCDALILYPRSYDENLSDSLVRPPIATAACSNEEAEYLTGNSDNIMTYDNYDRWVLSKDVLTQEGTKKLSEVAQSNEDVLVSSDDSLDDEDILSTISPVIEQYIPHEGEFNLVRTTKRHLEQIKSRASDVKEQHGVFTDYGVVDNSYHTIYLEALVPDKAQRTEEFNIIKKSANKIDENLVKKAEVLKSVVETEDAEFASVDGNLERSGEKLPVNETSEGEMTIKELYKQYDPGQIVIHKVSKYNYFATEEVLNEAPVNLSQIVDSQRDDLVYVPVLKSNFPRVKTHIQDSTHLIKKRRSYGNRNYNVKQRNAYAVLVLGVDLQTAKDLVGGNRIDKSSKLVKTMDSLPEESIPEM